MICYEEMLQYRFGWPHDDILPPIWKAWPTLRTATNGNSDVASARAQVVSCLADKGHRDVPEKLMFYWQDFGEPETIRARLDALTEEERRLMRLVARPTDDCALEHGYYLAQSDAWRQLVNPIVDADVDHDLVEALVISYIHFLLWLPGTVHMLTLDGALPLVRMGDIENIPPPGGVEPPLTVDQITPEPIPMYPGGMAGCKKVSYFLGNFGDKDWCEQEAAREIATSCATQADKAACVHNYFSDWIAPGEFGRAACAVHSEQWEFTECAQNNVIAMFTFLNNMGKEWATVLPAVNADLSVVRAFKKVKQCLATKGFDNMPDRFLYYWQDYVGRPDLYETFIADLSASEVAQMEGLQSPSQQCGVQEGFFAAQESALAEEVERLQAEDPERIANLLRWGLLGALKEPGIIHDLYGPQP